MGGCYEKHTGCFGGFLWHQPFGYTGKNIAAIEQTIHHALPAFDLYRAFTSEIIMNKLRDRDGIHIDNVSKALDRLQQDGYHRVLIQPTHVINGDEYNKLCSLAAPFTEAMSVSIGAPLLTSIQDYKDTVAAIKQEIPAPEEAEAIVFMGHGTEHHANAAYALLEYMLHDFGWKHAFVGTVEGYPALEQVMQQLKNYPEVKRVRLHPLMVVAGDHAKNDMAGEEKDSWRAQLQAAGYDVSCILHGLGEYESVRQLFAQHATAAQYI